MFATPRSLGLLLSTFALCAYAERGFKRGVAYALTDSDDFDALATGVAWWYNWHHSSSFAANYRGMEFVPMLWNFNFDKDTITASIAKHGSEYMRE
jgi:hypothetical protein